MEQRQTVAARYGKRTGKREKPRDGARDRARDRDSVFYAQMMVSGCLFLLLVGMRVLAPAQTVALQAQLRQALGHNMDVAQVFSAVETVLDGAPKETAQQVYQAVFAPAPAPQEQTLEMLPLVPEVVDTLEDSQTELEPTTVRYSPETLPENVSLEQTMLGFDYTNPLPTGTISSPFGYRGGDFHYGVDMAADIGTSIVAFADGTVGAVGESSSYGKYLMLNHNDGYSTLYAHCSAISVTSGANVTKGDTIAQVGDTGITTGPHLHFELQRDGLYLNPIYYVS